MIHLHEHHYAYQEEVNEGILKQFHAAPAGAGAVLDVGCGSGALGEAIAKRGYTVWGIEAYQEAAERAGGRLARVIHADLTQRELIRAEIGGQRFAYLVFSDVLEHLYDPYSVLREYLDYLEPGGTVLLSLPNAVVWTNRLAFLFGRFHYEETGVMDRTHIRFFTFRTARELLTHAGFRVVREDYTPFFVRALLPLLKRLMSHGKADERRQIIDSPAYQAYMRYVYPIEYVLGWWWKSLFAFRIILVGQTTPSPVPSAMKIPVS